MLDDVFLFVLKPDDPVGSFLNCFTRNILFYFEKASTKTILCFLMYSGISSVAVSRGN
jgi:hypothetical protein